MTLRRANFAAQFRRRRADGFRWFRCCVVLIGTAVALLAGCRPEAPKPLVGLLPEGQPPPNIIFILVDTLRADRLGAYGNSAGHTPMIDALAREGVTFEWAFAAAPWTQPSIASLFSSYYPSVHRVLNYTKALRGSEGGEAMEIATFNDAYWTLAELLKLNGYETAAFVANPFIQPKFGFAQGFDRFDGEFAHNLTKGRVVSKAAVDWLRERRSDNPFFLYLHYMDAHGPYDAGPEYLDPLLDRVEQLPEAQRGWLEEDEAPPRYLHKLPPGVTDEARHHRLKRFRAYWEARYDAGVREQDEYLAELRDKLSELGIWQNAYVILTADHGESFREHGFWEHGFCVHNSEMQVPLVLRWPGVLPPGLRVTTPARLIDVLPTLLAQLRFDPLEGIQGVSLLPAISGHTVTPPLALCEAVKIGNEQKAIFDGTWKLVFTPKDRRSKLYRLSDDPREQRDLAAANPTEVTRLQKLLNDLIADNGRRAQATPAQPAIVLDDPQALARLQALGYVAGPGDASGPETASTQPSTTSSPTERDRE